MARGYVFRPTYTYKGEKRRSKTWYIRYSVNGTQHRESSGSTKKEDAERLLARRIAEMRPGGLLPSELERVQFSELAELIRADYKRKGNKSSVEYRLAHLEAFFLRRGWKVAAIGEPEINQYIAYRIREKAAGGTINRELATLRRMFNLGKRFGLVADVPSFKGVMLPEKTREGFITEAQFQKLRAALPPRLRPLVETLYVTGWRKGDALSRTWADVDFEHGWLRIEGSATKEGKGRQFPLIPRLRSVLEEQRERKREVEEATGREVTALFFYYRDTPNGQARAGDPIRNFRSAWKTAATKAGVPDLLVHDLRRSAVRNAVRAGVPENTAMAYSGHRTRSILDRYDIVSERDLREGGEKLTAFYGRQEKDKNTGKVEAQRVDINEG